jgi:hypothetical protein
MFPLIPAEVHDVGRDSVQQPDSDYWGYVLKPF